MRVLESLPDRPLRWSDLEALEVADGIDGAYARFWTGESDLVGDYTAQFDLFLADGRGFAIHYDLDADEWRVVELIDDVLDVADAIERLEVALEEARGDDQDYGQRFAEVCGLL